MKLRSNSRTNIQRIVTITAGAALLVGTESATGAAFAENNNAIMMATRINGRWRLEQEWNSTSPAQ
ncbi:MAG: hypothetical protein WBH16_10255 [Candidatus Nanopelagicales bacterium]|jgi:hypothetical protein